MSPIIIHDFTPEVQPLAAYVTEGISFLMPSGKRSFWATHSNADTIFFDKCQNCPAYHQRVCEGGFRPINGRRCHYEYSVETQPKAGVFTIPNHLVEFDNGNEIGLKYFELTENDTLKYFPLRLGNVSAYGILCWGNVDYLDFIHYQVNDEYYYDPDEDDTPDFYELTLDWISFDFTRLYSSIFSGVFNGDYRVDSSVSAYDWLLTYSVEKQRQFEKSIFKESKGKSIFPLFFEDDCTLARTVLLDRYSCPEGMFDWEDEDFIEETHNPSEFSILLVKSSSGKWFISNHSGTEMQVTDDWIIRYLNNLG